MTEPISDASSQRDEWQIEDLLSNATVLAATAEISRRAGAWMRIFAPIHGVGLANAMIAATAEHHGPTLATLNVRHFRCFRD